jgi:hypothetical protein
MLNSFFQINILFDLTSRPDTTIDMHVFELDRLLSQMAQDCLDSLSSSSSTSSSIYSTISSTSSLTTPQRQLARSIIYDSASSTNLSKSKTPDNNYTPLRKSIECLYMTPTTSKQSAPLAPHCHATLDNDRRPKSASTILLASQSSTTPTVLSPRTHKFQRPSHKNFKMKMYRSEDDIMLAVNRHDEQQQKSDINDDEDTITLCENEKEDQQPQPNVRALARQFEQKTGSLPDHSRSKPKTPENHQAVHHATARTIINEQQEDNDEEELTWPQQQQQQHQHQHQSGGIKKFVRNGLKLFSTQSQQQQNKKTGK